MPLSHAPTRGRYSRIVGVTDGEPSDVGVNNLGEGRAAMSVLRHNHPWEAEAAAPRRWFGFGGWRKTGLKKHDRL